MSSSPRKSIRVRSYTQADHTAVVELFTAGMLMYMDPPGVMDPIFAPYFEESINGDLASIEATYMGSGGHFWVATCEDMDGQEIVVGMVGLEGKPDKAFELRRMSVRAEFRRDGVGKLLVAILEQWAEAHEVSKVCLSTGGPMLQAHKFYENMGYTLTKKEWIQQDFEAFFYEKMLQ